MYYAILFALFVGLTCPSHKPSHHGVTIHTNGDMPQDSTDTGGDAGHVPPDGHH